MKSITEIVAPIQLLKGTHADTGQTGQGCFMNVIAYLNGEPQITDNSPCVCFVVKPIAIWLNDYLTPEERQRLMPYIMRAMGSRSDDRAVFVPRAEAAARFARKCSDIAQASAESAASVASAASTARAESAASAAWAERAASAERAARIALIEAAFTFLDEALPAASTATPAVVMRAETLAALV